MNNQHKSSYKKPPYSTPDAFLDYFESVTGIKLQREVSSLGCLNPKTGCPLRFDGVSVDYRVIVEYDDISHFKENPRLDSTLEERRFRDSVKDAWAEGHGFVMVRFPYFERWTSRNILKRFPKNFKFPKFYR